MMVTYRLSMTTLMVLLIHLLEIFLPCKTVANNIAHFVTTAKVSIGYSAEFWQITRQTARSKIECATRCYQSASCVTFHFDRSHHTCEISTGVMTNHSGTVYLPYCSADKRYTLWIYPDFEFCLMYNKTVVNHAVASNVCKEDGGHLLSIRSNDMRLRLTDILAKMDVTSAVFLDGSKQADNTVIAWDGYPLHWVEWGSGNPGFASETCLQGKPDEAFLSRDTVCESTYFQFLCQIEL